jgi:hypothetical protein
MKTFSDKCINDNTVGSFCDCIADDECADVAAKAFCDRAKTDSGTNVTGDDLAELKKALTETDRKGCC